MSHFMKMRVVIVMLIGPLLCGAAAQAQAMDNLYQAQTTVTGTGEENRAVGVQRCFEDVLVKLTGVVQLSADPRLGPHKENAARFVRSYTYVDQMAGKPKRDEQGTRDRPYDLIVTFDPDKVNAVLAELNLKPWLSSRPLLGVLVAMNPGGFPYGVSSDSKRSELQKEALIAAADKRGMKIVLPDSATLEKLHFADFEAGSVSAAMVALAGRGAEVVLVGRLTWLDQELKWLAEWKLDWRGRLHRWEFESTTFDEVFRGSLGQVLQILAQEH